MLISVLLLAAAITVSAIETEDPRDLCLVAGKCLKINNYYIVTPIVGAEPQGAVSLDFTIYSDDPNNQGSDQCDYEWLVGTSDYPHANKPAKCQKGEFTFSIDGFDDIQKTYSIEATQTINGKIFHANGKVSSDYVVCHRSLSSYKSCTLRSKDCATDTSELFEILLPIYESEQVPAPAPKPAPPAPKPASPAPAPPAPKPAPAAPAPAPAKPAAV